MEYLPQLLGTLVTILGLVVAAPDAAGRLLPTAYATIARRANQGLAWVDSWRNVEQTNPGQLAATLPRLTARMQGPRVRHALAESATDQEKLTYLCRSVELIHTELDELHDGQRTMKAELSASLDQAMADLSELRQHAQAQQVQSRKVDARGFPLAAVGALVAGVPVVWGDPASIVWWLWGSLTALGVIAGYVAVRWFIEPDSTRAALRDGWRDARELEVH